MHLSYVLCTCRSIAFVLRMFIDTGLPTYLLRASCCCVLILCHDALLRWLEQLTNWRPLPHLFFVFTKSRILLHTVSRIIMFRFHFFNVNQSIFHPIYYYISSVRINYLFILQPIGVIKFDRWLQY